MSRIMASKNVTSERGETGNVLITRPRGGEAASGIKLLMRHQEVISWILCLRAQSVDKGS